MVSGSKDSAVCTELAIIVARARRAAGGRDGARRGDHVPGTYEYLDRVAQRTDEIRFTPHTNQPIINAFDRYNPYWWVFDPACPELWVRQPPPYATCQDLDIRHMVTAERFPAAPGRQCTGCWGARGRVLDADAGHPLREGLLHRGRYGRVRQQADLRRTDGDVWKAIHEQRWDYNVAYDVMPDGREQAADADGAADDEPGRRGHAAGRRRGAGRSGGTRWWPGCPRCGRSPCSGEAVHPGDPGHGRVAGVLPAVVHRRGAGWIAERAQLAMEKQLGLHAPTPRCRSRRPAGAAAITGIVGSWSR